MTATARGNFANHQAVFIAFALVALLNAASEKAFVARAENLIERMTRDMLEVPYHYASFIMLCKQFLLHQASQAALVNSDKE